MRNRVYRLAPLALLLFLGTLLISCGGGTAGTDRGGSTSVQGLVIDPREQPISGALISLLETGDQTLTDDTGRFALDTQLSNEGATVLVESAGAQASAPLDGVSSEAEVVDVELEFDRDQSTLRVRKEEIKLRPTPTPGPRATRTPRASPTSEAVVPTPAPTTMPPPALTETVIPTSTPIVEPTVTTEPSPTATATGTTTVVPATPTAATPTPSVSPTPLVKTSLVKGKLKFAGFAARSVSIRIAKGGNGRAYYNPFRTAKSIGFGFKATDLGNGEVILEVKVPRGSATASLGNLPAGLRGISVSLKLVQSARSLSLKVESLKVIK